MSTRYSSRKRTQLADVVLPAASFAEKEGTFTNADRRVQRVRKVVEPLPGCRTDVEIICELADRMGYAMPARTASDIMDEIAGLVPVMAGINYRRLDQQPLVWPCIDATVQGTRVLYETELSARASRPSNLPNTTAPAEEANAAYPLILTTGRRLEHYNCGSMTRRTPGLVELADEERLEINPRDAEPLNIRENQMVEVASRRGVLTVRAHISDLCSPGVVFLSFHFDEVPTNILVGNRLDPLACTPSYKVSAVRVTPTVAAE